MKKTIAILAGVGVMSLGGCAAYNSNLGYGGQPTGVVYSDYTTPGPVSNPHVRPVKTGKSCTHGLLWVAAWGKSGTDDAMKAGHLKKVSNVQYSSYSVLSGLYSKYCTIAKGQ